MSKKSRSKVMVLATRIKMALRFDFIERSIVQDKNFLYTIVAYSMALAIFLNLTSFQSLLIGLGFSVIYFVINAVFLGNAFFEKEDAFFRLMFGILLVTVLLGFVGWLTLIIYNLDVIRVTLVLLVVSTLSSLFNRGVRHKDDPE